MSNNKDTNNIEPKFDENQAYEELRFIFIIAIETQDFSTLETRIAAWEKKYPLADFTDPEIIRKIKAILNKDFLSRLIGDYLAAKILHEQEKQKEAYDSLKAIIDTAKKTKNYKLAQKEVRKWKDNLHENGFTLYSFDRIYRARVCSLLLLPSKELSNQEQAADELKKIKENGSTMNSEDYFRAISDWQNKYSIADFPEKLQKELNQITTEVFDSISQKRTSENAIAEIEGILSSKDIPLPFDSIASILSKYDYRRFPQDAVATIERLSMEALSIQDSVLDNGISAIDLSVITTISPTEAKALTSLRDILNKTPHDMDTILNWIYLNRKINYSEFARDEILRQFSSVGYIVPNQSSYSIPEINFDLDYQNFSEIDDIRKSVILNYLGIISQGNKLSIEGKDNIIEAHAMSAGEAFIEKEPTPTMFLEAFDTVVEQPEAEEEQFYDENGELDLDQDEEIIYNIFIEDIIDNPLATYSITTTSSTKSTDSSIEYTDHTVPATFEQNLDMSAELSDTATSNGFEEFIIDTKINLPGTTTSAQSSLEYSEDLDIPTNTQNTNDILDETNMKLSDTSDNKDAPSSEESAKIVDSSKKAEEPITLSTSANADISGDSDTETTSSTQNIDFPYSLTIEDDKSLDQAYLLSTYVVVAAPILEHAFSQKRQRLPKKQKILDIVKEL